ncbi:MAG: type II toxin-antitoxin system Phd/YefM family antitoxin [Planctomycetota bacterium]|nr:type II toxin-antitoxin system Phd/YefM family antitoxin [Planctomycetota bacterium]
MKSVGLFEAKTRLSAICDAVARTGRAVRITRRGRPWVVIAPCLDDAPRQSVWARRREFERAHGPLDEDFELPVRKLDRRTWRNPLR